mmetsp:Transcript_51996/g.62631  ORF Transcript_51996/g.62631 Transcript_51996/m.62631 type:complete len:231 (-) Transcript_51996:44-736(-)
MPTHDVVHVLVPLSISLLVLFGVVGGLNVPRGVFGHLLFASFSLPPPLFSFPLGDAIVSSRLLLLRPPPVSYVLLPSELLHANVPVHVSVPRAVFAANEFVLSPVVPPRVSFADVRLLLFVFVPLAPSLSESSPVSVSLFRQPEPTVPILPFWLLLLLLPSVFVVFVSPPPVEIYCVAIAIISFRGWATSRTMTWVTVSRLVRYYSPGRVWNHLHLLLHDKSRDGWHPIS